MNINDYSKCETVQAPLQALELQRGMVWMNSYTNSLYVFLNRNVRKCWGWKIAQGTLHPQVIDVKDLLHDEQLIYQGLIDLPTLVLNAVPTVVDPKVNEKLMKVFKQNGSPSNQVVGFKGAEEIK